MSFFCRNSHGNILINGHSGIFHSQVNISLRVLTRPIADNLPQIYRTLGTNYAERVLPSIVQARIVLQLVLEHDIEVLEHEQMDIENGKSYRML